MENDPFTEPDGAQPEDNQEPEQVGVKVPQNQDGTTETAEPPTDDPRLEADGAPVPVLEDDDAGRVPNPEPEDEQQDAPVAEAGSGLRGDPLHHGISN